MKRNLLPFIALSIFSFATKAQTPGDWSYAVQAGGSTADVARGIATDAAGNSYVTGYFDVSGFFTGNLSVTSLTSNGGNDIFVAKYDAAGYALWAVKAGGTQTDQGLGIAVDNNGNSYVTGTFADTATFYGSSNIKLITNGAQDAFIAKYDPTGNVVWAKKAGGINGDNGSRIKVDASGNTYITGTFANDTIVFYGSPNDSLFTNGLTDAFIAKLDMNGDVVWARKAGGSGNDNGYGIEIDASGNSYVAGAFLNKAYFYTATGKDSLTSQGSNDAFLAKYDPNGDLLWVRQAGSTFTDQGQHVALDPSGNVYFTGNLNGPCTFSWPGPPVPVSSNGLSDIFLARYDNAGNLKWAKHAGGTSSEFSTGIVFNASNHIALTGAIGTGSSTFYGTTTFTLTSAGSSDVFIAEYDTAGNALCAQSGGGGSFDRGWDIGSDAAGNSYIAGQFTGNASFQSTPTLTLSSVGAGSSDILIGKWLSSCSGTTGISKEDVSFNVFPNPAASNLFIVSEKELGSITITNYLGEIVMQVNAKGTQEQMDISKLPAGIYIVKALNKNAKIIKE